MLIVGKRFAAMENLIGLGRFCAVDGLVNGD
jgi:hypothetical protein